MGAVVTSAPTTAVQQIQPLEDSRWEEFVERSPNSSIFHTRGWLEALHRTYGYEPVVFTTSPPEESLENCLLFCRVTSWLTGSRLVSLPFSDHCAPLATDEPGIKPLLSAVEDEVRREGMDYLELRSPNAVRDEMNLARSEYSYCFHQIDLSPELDQVFRGFHKDSTQRKIRRAEREGLSYAEGRSDSLLNEFYRLMLITRRRHQVPPQPKKWFENLTDCLGDRLRIRVVSIQRQAVAAMVTLRHKGTLVYKYGASDSRFHRLGAVHLLFWRCIQEAKQQGLQIFELGRSNAGNLGLITFKDRWGGARSTLTYVRHGIPGRFEYRPDGTRKEQLAKRVISLLPDRLFQEVGQLLYRHVG